MPKRSVGLLIETIETETVVFDQGSQKIHRLEAEASQLFSSCDGTTPRRVVAENLYPGVEDGLDRLDALLAEMEELKLVETAPLDASRRAFLRKAAAAAIATPLIHTFLAPSPAQAKSSGPQPSPTPEPTCSPRPPGTTIPPATTPPPQTTTPPQTTAPPQTTTPPPTTEGPPV